MKKLLSCSAITLSFMLVEPAFAQSAVTLTAEFQRGAIAEYSNGANRTSNAELFSPSLSISSISISQVSADGNWGGTQGNDTNVTATISYTDGSTLVFPAAINWVKNAGGGGFEWIGLTTATTQNDGYTPPDGGNKTYILQFPQSNLNLSTLLPDGLDGSANSGGALNGLNLYFPGPGSSSLTFTSANAFSYLENSVDADVVGTVQTANASGAVTYSIISGNANGWYEIDPSTGAISLTPAGVAAAEPNDFETTPNSRVITVQADDGSNIIAQTITLSETDVAENPPLTFTSGSSFSYPENSADTDVLVAIAATGGSGSLTYSITAGNSDGWYTIDASSGEITLTAAGVAAVANDFEGAPNSHVLTVQASDGSSNATMDVTLSETDVSEAPSFTGTNATDGGGAASYAFSYAEGQAEGAALGQVAASDPDSGDTIAFAIAGGNTNGWFQIDGASGEISLTAAGVAAATNDFEAAPNAHTLTVTASDGTDTTSIEVVLSETDVDEVAPTITSVASFDVNEGETAVATLSADEAVTWSITGGVDQGDLSIDPNTGALTFDVAPDFEAPADDDGNNAYQIEVTATDAAGNTSVQSVTVNVLDIADTNTAPSFTGTNATDGGGAASYAFSYAEGQAEGAALGQVAASDPDSGDTIAFAIAGGNTNGWFQIDGASGEISLTAAGVAAATNDFEAAPNAHTLTVTASDGTDTTSIEVVLSETDVDEVAPTITGPSGGAGAGTGEITVDEGTTTVTQLTSDEPVTWSIAGGNDQGLFNIAPDGTISFVTPPDFEAPTDSDTNNTYALTIEAEDADGNISTQTITVTVADLDDTAPAVAVDGVPMVDGQASFEVLEGTIDVAAFTSDENVTWAVVDGTDRGQFSIGDDGALVFQTVPDFEAPSDINADNVYVLAIEATDENGNTSRILLDVTVLNVEDLQERVEAISEALRQGLRTHALVGLSDLLSYNEELMIGSFDCSKDREGKKVSGSSNATETSQNADIRFQDALTACGKSLRLLLDGGATISRLDGNSRIRGFASVRLEKNLSSDSQIGLNIIGSTASDTVDGFADSSISDFGLTGQIYGRVRLGDDLIAGAFAGYGQSWYDFDLSDDGLAIDGDYSGERYIVGGMMRGELSLGERPLTIDAVLSHATESLGNARFAASLDNESADDLTLGLGSVNATRISVPLTYSVFGPLDFAKPGIGLNLTAGGLCESNFFGSGLDCGIQAGGRLWRRTIRGSYAYLDLDFESAAGLSRYRIDAGYAFDIGLGENTNVAFSVGTIGSDYDATAATGLITLTAKQ